MVRTETSANEQCLIHEEKVIGTRSGCDPPSIVWIHLTLRPKFGYFSHVLLWSYTLLKVNFKRRCVQKMLSYRTSLTVGVSISVANFGKFQVCSIGTLLLHARF